MQIHHIIETFCSDGSYLGIFRISDVHLLALYNLLNQWYPLVPTHFFILID